MAPPLGLTSSMLGWCSFSQASTTEAKASLISTASMSSSVSLARSSTVGRGRDGPGQHGDRVDAGQGEGVEAGPGAQAQRVGLLLAHDQDGRGAVGDLRRVAGRDLAVLLEGGLELGQRLDGGVGPDALVGGEDLVGVVALVVADGHGHDLVLEAALGGGPGGPLVALHREGVELLARDAPLVGDHLGADALADQPRPSSRRSGPSCGARRGSRSSRTTEEPMGVRVMDSTPAATTTS